MKLTLVRILKEIANGLKSCVEADSRSCFIVSSLLQPNEFIQQAFTGGFLDSRPCTTH
jgi:hypothetical protein